MEEREGWAVRWRQTVGRSSKDKATQLGLFFTCDLVLLFSHFHIMPYFLIDLLFCISYP